MDLQQGTGEVYDKVDVKQIAERIKARIEQKRKNGLYDDREIARLSSLSLKHYEKEPAGTRTLLFEHEEGRSEIFRKLDSSWDVAKLMDVSSPKSGFRGKLIALREKIFRKFVQPKINMALFPQTEFNCRIWQIVHQLLNGTEQEINFIKTRMGMINPRLQYVERFTDEADKRLDTLETGADGFAKDISRLSATLLDMERQGVFFRNRVEKLLETLSASGETSGAAMAKKEQEKLRAWDYIMFENLHRGSREKIRERMSVYAEWFRGASDVLDVGCGRGELIELFNERGITARGIDLNTAMVEECAARGIPAVEGDAISYLESLPANSLGGVTAIQVIEHLPVEVMERFFTLALEKLRPGGIIAAETINPSCLTTFCGAFYLDMSHTKPVHPLAVQFMLERIGYKDTRVEYLNPYPEEMRLQPVSYAEGPEWFRNVAFEFNRNVSKLNGILYSHTDYAVVARK